MAGKGGSILDAIAPGTASALEDLKTKRMANMQKESSLGALSELIPGVSDAEGIIRNPFQTIQSQPLQQPARFSADALPAFPNGPPLQPGAGGNPLGAPTLAQPAFNAGPGNISLPPPPIMSAASDQMSPGRQLQLLAKADPSTFLNAATQQAILLPRLKAAGFTPSQISSYLIDPKAAGEANAKAQFPETPTEVRTVQILQNQLQGMGQNDPRRPTIENLIKKAQGFETDPNKIDETKASIAEKGAQTDYARARGNLISDTSLDPDTLEFRAQMWAAGDEDGAYKGIPTSIYGSQARRAISQRGAQIAMSSGATGGSQAATNAAYAGDKAGLKTAATAGAKMDTLATEVENFSKIALDASSKVPRGSFVPLTKAQQLIEAGTSSPELAAFVAANTSLVNAYSAVAGRGTPTVAGQEHAYKMLSTAMSPEAYEAVVKQLLRETAAAKASPNTTIADIQKRIQAPGSGGVTMPAQPNASATGAQAAPSPAPPPAQRQANTVYATPKGSLRWTGTGWVAP